MTSVEASSVQHRFACVLCARRKVKCDKQEPCANCVRADAQCTYQPPVPSQRHRKRTADADLLSRISHYEALLRKNRIDFNPADNGWIPSAFEAQLPTRSQDPSPIPPSPPAITPKPQTSGEQSLWAELDPSLQNPPTHSSSGFPTSQSPQDGWGDNPGAVLLNTATDQPADVHRPHPEPRHILKLWQIFVENTNPLLKIVHCPTLQEKIFEASWNPQAAPRQTECLMYAVYLLAVVSIGADKCRSLFEEERHVLLQRYRVGTAQALMAAGLFSSRDLEVLQAFVMFLCADPDSEETTTLTAIAVRLGHKLGLHADNPKLSFFEREMRIRLWWQIRTLDARGRLISKGNIPSPDFGDVRLPLNVNDSELHPDMANCPVEHVGATEMLFCLMKYEAGQMRKPSKGDAKNLGPRLAQPFGGRGSKLAIRLQAVTELERVYEEKYLRHCDPRIPLHFLALTMARLAVCRLRFMMQHPRNCGDEPISAEECNALFELGVYLLRLESDSRKTHFSPQLLSHLARAHLDALVYVVSELRQRTRGERVAEAWKLVAEFYESNVEYVNGADPFHNALGDLVLQAWEPRRRELVEGRGATEEDVTPQFVLGLQRRRRKGGVAQNDSSGEHVAAGPSARQQPGPSQPLAFGETQEPFLDMPLDFDGEDIYEGTFWNNFIRM